MLSEVQRLKLVLMSQGIEITPSAREAFELSNPGQPLTLADYATTSGVGLVLMNDIWVNAPIEQHNPNFVTRPSARLVYQAKHFSVRYEGLEVGAQPVPIPRYSGKTSSVGEPYSALAITHTDRVRISPVQGCSISCTFCDLPYKTKYRKYPAPVLVEAVAAALEDETLPARHVLISGGTPRPEDYTYENEVYESVCRAFPNVKVDIMMVPLPGLLDPLQLASIGINELSINIELYNEDIARKLMPAKWKVGLSAYLDFIEASVHAFGPGRVRSLLVVGLEPIEDTLRGVEALARRGCTPVLSPFRPDPVTPLRNLPSPDVATLTDVYERSTEIVSKFGLRLGPRCIPCHHNTLTFPDGSGFYHSI